MIKLLKNIVNKKEITLKNNLRKYRFFANEMSQEELSSKLQVSRQTIHSIEKSKFNPSVKLALRIAQLFEKKVEDIFYLEEMNND
jgi:putative transcriptional regulator